MPNNLFPYPGNKARHSEWILEHIPEHECYVEVFGGAGGILFNKPASNVEIYNDLNEDIVQFFRVLRDNGDRLKEWLRNTPYSKALHEKYVEAFYDGHRPDDEIERAGRFFYLRYTQFGGKAYGKSGFATAKSRNRAQAYQNKVDALGEFAERLRNVQLQAESWEQMFERYDGPDTVFYLDPPYMGTEQQYGSGGFDHRELYKAVSDAEGVCAVSYDSIPPFYGDEFTVAAKDSTFKIDNTGGGPKDATEYLIMNYDSKGEPIMSNVGQQTLTEVSD